jgi:hypothetical protein
LVATLIAALGLIGYLVTTLLSGRLKSIEEQAEEEHQRLFRKEASEALQRRIITRELSRADVDRLLNLNIAPLYWSGITAPSKERIRKEVQDAVTAFQERLERIEQRFPDESTIDKIASINDAILATKVEQLQKALEQLEPRLLTKWDVATIVFAVLAAIGGLAGVIFAVANFVLK